ncbi:MAG TPA: type II toxin-antitoxin system VapC family toxin [Candidatus Methanomethylia archaeon]|nr:type II toxin-antitoxin system VapC family toxin [Candidatus Methanomethylicia archaeon]
MRLEVEAFRRLRNLGEVPLTSSVLIEASRLREQFKLTYFDSLHAASALLHDGKIASIDAAYSRIPELEVIDPRTLC